MGIQVYIENTFDEEPLDMGGNSFCIFHAMVSGLTNEHVLTPAPLVGEWEPFEDILQHAEALIYEASKLDELEDIPRWKDRAIELLGMAHNAKQKGLKIQWS